MPTPRVGERYRHYRNNSLYEVLAIAHNADNDSHVSEIAIIYRSVDTDVCYHRRLEEFMSVIGNNESGPIYRFARADDLDLDAITRLTLQNEPYVSIARNQLQLLLTALREAERERVASVSEATMQRGLRKSMQEHRDLGFTAYEKLRDTVHNIARSGEWDYARMFEELRKLSTEDHFFIDAELARVLEVTRADRVNKMAKSKDPA